MSATLHRLAVTLLMAYALSPSCLAQIDRTPWEMWRDGAWILLPERLSQHGDTTVYQYASIPAPNDPEWQPAPDGELIGFSQRSIFSGGQCLWVADFTYFQTFVDIPSDIVVDEFIVTFDGIDDGAQTKVYNSTYPGGAVIPGSYVFLRGTGTADLSELVNAGEVNRIVITQVDNCREGNHLREARVVIDSTVIGTGMGSDGGGAIPDAPTLPSAYPNPASERATLRFGLSEAGQVRVAVYDVTGREVAVVHEGTAGAGWHEAVLDASYLASGVYVIRATAGAEVVVRQLTVVR